MNGTALAKRPCEPSIVAHWISHQTNFFSTYSSSPRAPADSSCPQPVAVIKAVSLPHSHRIIVAIKSIGPEDRPPGLRHPVMGPTHTHWITCLTVRADCHIACARQACLTGFLMQRLQRARPFSRQKNCRVKSCRGASTDDARCRVHIGPCTP